jgi:hypothetical protein
LLQSAAVPDAVVVVAADAVVVAGAAVEDGVLAGLSGSEELHPAAISATSAVTTSRPMGGAPHCLTPLCPVSKGLGLAVAGIPLSDEWVQQDPVGVAARA